MRPPLEAKWAPSKAKPSALPGSSSAFSSHSTVASGSTKRRMSQAHARRSAHVGQRLLGAGAGLGGKEIERGDGVELATLLDQHARDGARVGVAEADAQALDGLDELDVAR